MLARLCARNSAREKAAPIELVVTQDDVAGLVGAARPTVNRELRVLESDGVVSLRRGAILVVDAVELRRRR